MTCSQSPSYRSRITYQPLVFQAFGSVGVVLRRLLAVVCRAVDEDRDRAAGPTVDEVRLRVRAVDGLLGVVGQPVAAVLEPRDELLFEGAVGLGDQPDGVFGP